MAVMAYTEKGQSAFFRAEKNRRGWLAPWAGVRRHRSPCRMRAKSRKPRLKAMPQSRELSVKLRMQIRKKRLRPSMPTNHPLIGRTMAFETRVRGEHPGALVIAGTEISGDVRERDVGDAGVQHLMNAARDTTTAMSQGFTSGRDGDT